VIPEAGSAVGPKDRGMTTRSRRTLAAALSGFAVLAVAQLPASDAADQGQRRDPSPRSLDWRSCPDHPRYDCARLRVPRDYADPDAGSFRLAVARLPARDQAHRIGSLFVNFGGPGGTGVQTLLSNGTRLFGRLNQRFDIVSFDPRGVGQSTPAIDCRVDQEHDGPFGQPFETPLDLDRGELVRADRQYLRRCQRLNPGVLPYVSTANVARDMDRLRELVGDARLSYLGLSYGSFLGATYAAMFPDSYRVMALEGPFDAEQYVRDPIHMTAATSAAMDRATGRFLQYCAAHQDACSGFGGDDPGRALDRLATRLDRHPLPVGERALDGDDLRVALGGGLRSPDDWDALAGALVAAQHGDGSMLRELADGFYGRQPDGTYRPFLDAFFAISAADQRNPVGLRPYLRAGRASWDAFDHSYFLSGYSQHLWGADRTPAPGAYRGPFTLPDVAPPVLVVGTTYDPASPYEAARALVDELGNARLLTLDADGHGAYGGESACVHRAVDRYLRSETLPPPGTRCGLGGDRLRPLGHRS
jgi:pimeloyl-ACP methyl ester carboxylesterase